MALLKAGAGVAAVRLAGMAAGLALTLVLSRVLGPEGIGGYGYVVMLLALAAVPVSNGWATVLLRATGRAQGGAGSWGEVAGLFRWGLPLAAGLTLLLTFGPGLLFLGPWGQGIVGLGSLALLAVVLFFDQLSALRLAVLRGLDHPVWGQVPEMLMRPVLILVFFLLLTQLQHGTPSLFDAIVALVSASVLAALVGGAILWRKAPAELHAAMPEAHPRAWSRSAMVLGGNAGLVLLNAQTDFLILGVLGTAEDLGYYRVAMQIAVLSGFVYTALNMIAMQRFARFFATAAHDELQRSATFLARLAFLGALPLPVIFALWGETILRNLFGPGFEAALTPLMWLLGLQVLNAGVGFAHSALVMGGREGRILPLTVLCIILNATLCLFLIPHFGIAGAAMASFASLGFWNLLLLGNTLVLRGVDSSILGFLPRARSR